MNKANIERAEKIIQDLVCGSALDCIRVYSMAIYLCFLRLEASFPKPKEIWLAITGNIRVVNQKVENKTIIEQLQNQNFFDLRGAALKDMYLLMGEKISSAQIDEKGTLIVNIGNKKLIISTDDNPDEEIWSVMNDSPDERIDHEWYIALTEKNEIIITAPV